MACGPVADDPIRASRKAVGKSVSNLTLACKLSHRFTTNHVRKEQGAGKAALDKPQSCVILSYDS